MAKLTVAGSQAEFLRGDGQFAPSPAVSGMFLCAPYTLGPSSALAYAISAAALTPFTPAATTVAAGSNGGEVSQVATWSSPSAGVLDVATTAGWPAAGTVTVAASGSTTAVVTYTGTAGGNQLTGCQYVSGSATGTVATGGAVTLTSSAFYTGSFTAPPSGSVLVAASFVASQASAGATMTFGLTAHAAVTPVYGNLVTWRDTATDLRACTITFPVTGLTAGTYNFDLVGASSSGALTIEALGTQTPPTSGIYGGPVTMTVQGV